MDKELQGTLTDIKVTLGRIDEYMNHHSSVHVAILKRLNNHKVAIKGTLGNPGIETRLEVTEVTLKRWEKIIIGMVLTTIGIMIETLFGVLK